MDKIIVTDPLYLKCKRMVETCNKNQTEMAKNYLKLAEYTFMKKLPQWDADWGNWFCNIKTYFNPLRDKLEDVNG